MKISPDVDVADIVQAKKDQWELEYGEMIANIQKFSNVATNLDLNKRKKIIKK